MNVPSLTHRPTAAEVPLDQLARNPNLSEADKIREVSRQFEAVLLRQILQNARKTIVPSKFNPDSAQNSIYQDLVTSQLADHISQSGTFGLADVVREQLTRQLAHRPETAPGTEAIEPKTWP
jgi:Rod binding domain-containing protein